MNAKSIFLNESNRLRSGWRAAIFLLFFFFLSDLADAIIAPKSKNGFAADNLLFILISRFISLSLAVLLGWLCGKFLENLPFRALGAAFTKNWLKDLTLGLCLGAASFGFAALIAVSFGGLSFQFNQTAGTTAILSSLAVSFAVFAVAAAFEEAFYRGYLLQTFSRSRLAWLAIALTSLFFASAHLQNPSVNYFALTNTVLAGVWFSVAYLKTRTLWLVFGLHLSWNWTQGAVFGVEVSGLKNIAPAPLLREIDSGPAWLTGADYGVEGGIACTAALVFSIALIYFLPFLKPTEEMLALTSEEKPKDRDLSDNV